MSMSRFDPFREMLTLREAMAQLLEESVIRPGAVSGAAARGGAQSLALDVHERDNNFVVRASLPGVRPEDVQVTVHGDTLTIRAEIKGEEERNQGGYLLRERHTGVLQRTVTLPAPIEGDEVQADYEHGVLTLTLPRSRASMPRRIQVRAGAGGGQPAIVGGQSAASGGSGGAAPDPGPGVVEGSDVGARLPSLEEATPGLDTAVREQTLRDAEAFYGGQQGQGGEQGQAGQQGTQGSGTNTSSGPAGQGDDPDPSEDPSPS